MFGYVVRAQRRRLSRSAARLTDGYPFGGHRAISYPVRYGVGPDADRLRPLVTMSTEDRA